MVRRVSIWAHQRFAVFAFSPRGPGARSGGDTPTVSGLRPTSRTTVGCLGDPDSIRTGERQLSLLRLTLLSG